MNKTIYLLFLVCLLVSQPSIAVTIVECEDDEGNRSFQAHCPPDQTEVQKKKLSTSIPGPIQPDITPVMYMVENCRACDAVRKFFSGQDIGILEKNIDDNQDLQNELKGLVGDLKIPTIIIEDQILTDYKRDQLVSVLEEAGFILSPGE